MLGRKGDSSGQGSSMAPAPSAPSAPSVSSMDDDDLPF